MIILFGGEKGGTGKSTLATNMCTWLALNKKEFILVDADKQGTSSNWAALRNSNENLPSITCIQKFGHINKTVADLSQKYENVVVDAAGRDSQEFRSSLVVADILVAPLQPSQCDLWTTEHLFEIINLAKPNNPDLKTCVVLTRASSNPKVKEIKEAKELLVEYEDAELMKAIIKERKVYKDAICEGRGVMEMRDNKARQEVNNLCAEIFTSETKNSETNKESTLTEGATNGQI